MNRMPSPNHRTTVLGRIKAPRAKRGGFAGLDPACAPWFTKLWAMDEGGLRRRLRTQEVSHHDKRCRITDRPGRHRTDVARARGARLENPRNFLGDSPTGRTLELRQRQLRDEGMSGVNQHAYIRLIHRRFKLLVP